VILTVAIRKNPADCGSSVECASHEYGKYGTVFCFPLAINFQSDATSSVLAVSATLPKAAAGRWVLRLNGTAIAPMLDENVEVNPAESVSDTVIV
jgi:hypothetical protein